MTKPPDDPGNKLALIIGIDAYKSEGLGDLPSCKKDAEDLYKLLFNDLGYRIFGNEAIIGSNLEGPYAYTKVHRAIVDFFDGAEPGQTLLFYFSGHGIPREDELYLGMPEVKPKNPMVEGFSLSNLTRLMNSSRSMRIVSIIDACYSGSANLPDSSMQKKASEETAGRALATYDRVLDNIPKSEGRCFLLSSQAYEPSLAIPGSNSLYTKHLVEGLRGAEPSTDDKGRKIPSSVDDSGNVTPETLHNYVYHKVANEVRQVPKIKFEKASNIIIAEHPQMSNKPNQDEKSWIITEEGKQYFENEDYENAIESFNRAIELNPKKNYYAHYYKGSALLKLQKYEEAIGCYDEALKILPKFQQGLRDKGISFERIGKYHEAIECFDAALEINPYNWIVWYHKGLSFSHLSKYNEAIGCYDQVLKINPKHSDASRERGLALERLGRQEDISLVIDEGMQHLENEDYENAIKLFDKAIQLNPNSPVPHNYKGDVLFKLQKFEEAVECYDEALKINPKYFDVLKDKGMSLYNLGKYEEAVEYFDKALAINPKSQQLLHFKGMAYFELKDYEEAIKCYDKALEINPDNEEILKHKELLMARLKDRSSSSNKNSIDWDNVIMKEARGSNDEDLGEVQGITNGHVIVIRGLINKGEFYIPQDKAESFDGDVLRLSVSESELQGYREGEGQKGRDTKSILKDTQPTGYVFIKQWPVTGVDSIDVDSSGFIYAITNRTETKTIQKSFFRKEDVDTYYSEVQKFDSNGTFIAKWGSEGSGVGEFDSPIGIAVDSSGCVYVADYGNSRVQKFDGNGTFIAKWGSLGSGDGEFMNPTGIAVDSSGCVYVADTDKHRIQKFREAKLV